MTTAAPPNGAVTQTPQEPKPKSGGRIATLETQVAELQAQMGRTQQLVAEMLSQKILGAPELHQKLTTDLVAKMQGHDAAQPPPAAGA